MALQNMKYLSDPWKTKWIRVGKKEEKKIIELNNNFKLNTSITKLSPQKEWEEKILKKMMAETLPNLMKTINLQIHEVQYNPKARNMKKTIPTIIKLYKTSNKYKTAVGGGKPITT